MTVTVPTLSPAPVFDWTSACPVGLLEVNPLDGGSFVWSVVAEPGQNAMRPPMTYGVAPAGAAVMMPADPLVSGRQYRVLIRRAGDYFGLEQIGAAEFTAQ